MTTSGDPADAMFTRRELPRRVEHRPHQRQGSLLRPDGPRRAIGRNARIAQDGTTYNILGASIRRAACRRWGSSSATRGACKPNLTVNAGLRYDVQMPFYALNNSYSTADHRRHVRRHRRRKRLRAGFDGDRPREPVQARRAAGAADHVQACCGEGTQAYNTDRGNFAPSVGVAWTVGRGQRLPAHDARQAGRHRPARRREASPISAAA